MIDHKAIYALNPSVVSIRGDEAFDVNGILVEYDKNAVQAYVDANAYKTQRAQAYPSIADQLDLLYHGGMDAWREAIEAVKQEYPKP
jgi:hypothetical protein